MTSLSNLINERSFRRLALLTVLSVFLLILVGGIVRSTGSGMGCPDWPKCFGQWVPPTDVSELPANYQQIYAHRGYKDVQFNVAKTWTEYLNRLLGALIGVFIFLTFAASIKAYWRRDRPIVGFSFLAFLLVGFQGWLGAKVVSSVLSGWLITLHMLLAIIIVGVLLYVATRSQAHIYRFGQTTAKPSVYRWIWISSGLLLFQILLGTQVREMVDEVASQLGQQQRYMWVSELGIRFYVHRTFSLVVLASQLAWILPFLRNNTAKGAATTLASFVVGLILIEIATGAIMGYFAIPAWAQPVHLTLAVTVLGFQFLVILLLYANRLLPDSYKDTSEMLRANTPTL
ncbi:COX15/CtaA family protein [Fibrella sp. HMF5335]|uniref:COX15/CtaA family protein n=1 Tax=Fibrella rubiginis TaxID=2817060 RepID=A0A939GJB8_9BACT|nr:COX15/CtaA family protein [Fibrella rubiginis]MBO0939376.1 COX15/CtaA family protein [Fibrella rubiginis]